MKKCKNCLTEKDVNDFHKKQSKCKECFKEFYRENKEKILEQANSYYHSNKEVARLKRREYYHNNIDILRPKMNEWKKNNKELIKQINKDWYEENKEKITKKRKEDYINNYESIRDYYNEYYRNKRKYDPIFKLKGNISSLIRETFKSRGFRKCDTQTIKILGCSIDEFRIHLESQFKSWMNWDNHGKYNGDFDYGWDIDHIIPICTAKSLDDVINLNHYSNLQPLCSKINREMKSGKINFNINEISY